VASTHVLENAKRTTVSSSNRKSHRVTCKKNVIYVEKDGSGNFTTIQAAINSLPRRNKCRAEIKIGAGVFRSSFP
jgi:pectin methylesterase-like acyl-CoA thioesterase